MTTTQPLQPPTAELSQTGATRQRSDNHTDAQEVFMDDVSVLGMMALSFFVLSMAMLSDPIFEAAERMDDGEG